MLLDPSHEHIYGVYSVLPEACAYDPTRRLRFFVGDDPAKPSGIIASRRRLVERTMRKDGVTCCPLDTTIGLRFCFAGNAETVQVFVRSTYKDVRANEESETLNAEVGDSTRKSAL